MATLRINLARWVLVILPRLSQAALAAASYTLTDLGPGAAGGITSDGRLLFHNNGQTFVYDNGQYTPLSFVAGAMNDGGQFVGGITVDGWDHSALYTNSIPTDIGTLGGTSSYANGFNNPGQVVGVSDVAVSLQYHAFLYQNGQMTGTKRGRESFYE